MILDNGKMFVKECECIAKNEISTMFYLKIPTIDTNVDWLLSYKCIIISIYTSNEWFDLHLLLIVLYF